MELNREELTASVKNYLLSKGAALTGVADMSGIANCHYHYGISVAIPIPPDIVRPLQKAPTHGYYEKYTEINRRLNALVFAGESFLKERGYNAYALTVDRVQMKDRFTSSLPHKTVATQAGIGWIGKNCLLVTEKYGSAVRISSIYTDAPLIADAPVRQSRCGTCQLCVNACPAHALKGKLWQTDTVREEIADIKNCYNTMISITKKSLGFEMDICGKCFAVCRYTKKYLNSKL